MSVTTLSTGTDYEVLANKFRPIFEKIAKGTLDREQKRQLPVEPIKWLKEAGFGAVRVPKTYGGDGASLPQLFQLLIELATADSNLPQALRGHFAFVEDKLNAPQSASRDKWFERFVAGDIVGNAWTEVGTVKIGDVITKVSQKDGKTVVNGNKFYTTGSIFADWIDVYAQRAHDKSDVIAAVKTHQAGVTVSDDWDGFGQRTTGSGTAVFQDAEVEAEDVIDFNQRFKYQTAFYQLVLLAVQSGIAKAVERDVSQQVRERHRVYSTGNADQVKDDAQILQVIGQISAQAFTVETITLRAAESAQRAYLARFSRNDEEEKSANIAAEIDSAKAQVVASELVLRASTDLFNALGASAAKATTSLDRHWRNARTVSSHNPLIYKARIVGDWVVNDKEPPYVWQIGSGNPEKAKQQEKAKVAA